MIHCPSVSIQSRRRTFWATQPAACGIDINKCNNESGRAGLTFINAPTGDARSIVTENWLRGLCINILMTDAKLPNRPCGYSPGTQGGHWSESFRKDGLKIGSLARNVPPARSVLDYANAVRAQLIFDINKLVSMKIATKISVDVKYIGGNRMLADIIVTGQSGEETRVGLSGARLQNNWAWN